MASLFSANLLWPLVAAAAFNCGGRANSQERAGAGAGDVSSLGGADASVPTQPPPSVVQVSGNDGDVDPQATPECLNGFQGFYARLGEISADFKAFVAKPGDYEGDSVQILWLEVSRANGEHYRAAAGTSESSGKISLHVQQVEPRFRGSLEALLPALDDPTRAPLMLTLSFDIAVRAGCPS
jgi:hypothetical protein